jgi:4'-phosphopantetheinyl transferase
VELGNDTHVWLAPLDLGEPDIASLVVLLAPDEQQRGSQFRFDRDRRHFIVARGLLRRLLARYAGGAPAQIEFCYGPQGKPALAGRDDMQFNVAHSHGAGLFAFTRGAPIGVDAEQIRPLEYEALAAGFFSPAERTTLMAMPVERRQDAFFTYWARKEAYVKALGWGLSVPLDRFDVAAPDASARLLADRGNPDAPQQWSLHDIDAGPALRAAVAVKKQDTRICVFGTLDAGSCGPLLFPFSD